MEDIISQAGEKSDVVSLNGDIHGQSVDVKIQFWKPEGIFAAWRIGTQKGMFKRGSKFLAEGKYATYEKDRLILGKNAYTRDNEDKIEFIELSEKAQEQVKEQEKNMHITYQSPSGGATDSHDTSNLELAPENAKSGDCFVFEMSTWKLTDEPFYFQPWRFQDSKAVYFAWKFADKIGMYGSFTENDNEVYDEEGRIWLNGSAPAFIHFDDKELRQKIRSQVKELRGKLSQGIEIED
ncbi:MAG: hypothetical protein ABEJ07_06605 [Candidatus Nanohaloarchaea archaeon]